MDADPYQKILSELESYLDAEISEWYKIARAASEEEINIITLQALVDIMREIARLKRLYLSTQDK
jgi:hypothetical protein